jgi:putative ABC transport system permease protein
MNTIQFLGALEMGLLYGIVAIGVYLTFRIINFPDLTVDGSFPLGAAVSATLIVNGFSPILATVAAIIAGAVAGFITGYLHVRWRILGLLSGILSMTALYSINLRIMGKPNIAVPIENTLFTESSVILPALSFGVILLIVLLAWFLRSQFGLALRATGINPKVSPTYGINVGVMTLVALSLSNGFVALAGCLFVQSHGFADATMGGGTLIMGLASVIVGETLFHSVRIWILVLSCVLGSILYRIAIALALNTHFAGLQSSDLNLITSGLIILALLLPQIKKRIFQNNSKKIKSNRGTSCLN